MAKPLYIPFRTIAVKENALQAGWPLWLKLTLVGVVVGSIGALVAVLATADFDGDDGDPASVYYVEYSTIQRACDGTDDQTWHAMTWEGTLHGVKDTMIEFFEPEVRPFNTPCDSYHSPEYGLDFLLQASTEEHDPDPFLHTRLLFHCPTNNGTCTLMPTYYDPRHREDAYLAAAKWIEVFQPSATLVTAAKKSNKKTLTENDCKDAADTTPEWGKNGYDAFAAPQACCGKWNKKKKCFKGLLTDGGKSYIKKARMAQHAANNVACVINNACDGLKGKPLRICTTNTAPLPCTHHFCYYDDSLDTCQRNKYYQWIGKPIAAVDFDYTTVREVKQQYVCVEDEDDDPVSMLDAALPAYWDQATQQCRGFDPRSWEPQEFKLEFPKRYNMLTNINGATARAQTAIVQFSRDDLEPVSVVDFNDCSQQCTAKSTCIGFNFGNGCYHAKKRKLYEYQTFGTVGKVNKMQVDLAKPIYGYEKDPNFKQPGYEYNDKAGRDGKWVLSGIPDGYSLFPDWDVSGAKETNRTNFDTVQKCADECDAVADCVGLRFESSTPTCTLVTFRETARYTNVSNTKFYIRTPEHHALTNEIPKEETNEFRSYQRAIRFLKLFRTNEGKVDVNTLFHGQTFGEDAIMCGRKRNGVYRKMSSHGCTPYKKNPSRIQTDKCNAWFPTTKPLIFTDSVEKPFNCWTGQTTPPEKWIKCQSNSWPSPTVVDPRYSVKAESNGLYNGAMCLPTDWVAQSGDENAITEIKKQCCVISNECHVQTNRADCYIGERHCNATGSCGL